MKYSVVVSSRTGNTKMLADVISARLSGRNVIYTGSPADEAAEADFIFAGFWTDKGSCDDSVRRFLEKLENKTVFLFGTSGFGQSPAYFEEILGRVKAFLPPSCTVAGTFMCQGKMPPSVRERYKAMLAGNPDDEKIRAMIANFDTALSHPDENDLNSLKSALDALNLE